METKYIAIWKATWAKLKMILELYPKLRGEAITQVALLDDMATERLAAMKAQEAERNG